MDDNNCPVCYENYSNVITSCNHTFCDRCVTEILIKTSKCAICRRTITKFKSVDHNVISELNSQLLVMKIRQTGIVHLCNLVTVNIRRLTCNYPLEYIICILMLISPAIYKCLFL
jgi:hypothetical protein